MARVFLVDTQLHMYRAFHALPPMNGTQVVHGVVGILANLWRSERIRHIACVFEPLGQSHRVSIDPNYKAHRPPMPEELATQVPLVEEACRALGLATYRCEPYEADDVLATLTVQAVRAGHEVVVVSNDKDLAQLCAYPGVSLLRIKGQGKSMSLEYVDDSQVQGLFGVPPALIPSWLALNGDAVDNIPGVPGVGPKTACKLLLEFGELPGLLERARGRHSELLVAHRDQLVRNLELATLRSDLPVEFSLAAVTPGPFNGLIEFFRRMGMKRHLAPLEGPLLFHPQSVLELWS